MLKIRLQRVGKKNQASFRIVLAEKQRAASKKVQEVLGYYNPRGKQFGVKNPERLQYWISQHVEISPTMNNLLIDKGFLKGEKVKAWRPKQKPADEAGKKAEEAKPAEATAPAEAGVPTEVGKEKKEEMPAAEQTKEETGA